MTDLTKDDEEKSEEIRMTHIAILDENDIYQGMQEIPECDLAEHHFHLPLGCDLAPGKYKLDRAKGTFVPVTPTHLETKFAPEFVNAMAVQFMAMYLAGQKIEQYTLSWIDFHIDSFDFASAGNEAIKLARDYRMKRKG